jgi:hypothetical protein
MDTMRGFFAIDRQTTLPVYHIADSFAKKK